MTIAGQNALGAKPEFPSEQTSSSFTIEFGSVCLNLGIAPHQTADEFPNDQNGIRQLENARNWGSVRAHPSSSPVVPQALVDFRSGMMILKEIPKITEITSTHNLRQNRSALWRVDQMFTKSNRRSRLNITCPSCQTPFAIAPNAPQ
jgi:hypothetical protein